MTGVRTTICVFTALAGLALAQESLEVRGRSIPENSIEFRLRAADLAQEQAAEDRTFDYEVWNQPLRLTRTSDSSTPDQPLWVVIRRTTEGVSFDEYPSAEEALRGIDKKDIWRGVVIDRHTGAEVWNQSADKFSTNGATSFTWAEDGSPPGIAYVLSIGRHIGVPTGRLADVWWWGHCDAASSAWYGAVLGADKWWGICHGASPASIHAYDIEADFDGAMLAAELADSTTGSDQFQTTSPGHKTVGEITLVAVVNVDARSGSSSSKEVIELVVEVVRAAAKSGVLPHFNTMEVR